MFGQRIAQKIWLGYAIPLAVLVVMGVLVPAALSAILGQITREDERNSRFVEKVATMQNAAVDAESQLRGYALSDNPFFLGRYRRSLRTYQDAQEEAGRLAVSFPAAQQSQLQTLLGNVEAAHRDWRRDIAAPQMNRPDAGVDTGEREFQRVRVGFERLLQVATTLRDRQADRARAAEQVRRLMTFLGPLAALLLALLIGRSIAVGVTRPLEDLTRATEALERGQTGLLLEAGGDSPDDEIGDLKRSFAHMTRTIGQREAVLRAQNAALGALNRRVEAVLNATNDGIVMLDRGGGFSVVNQRFADLFGLDADDLLDQTFEQAGPLLLARFKDSRAVRSQLRDLFTDPDAVADETHEIVEPEHRVLRIYSAPVRGETGDLLGRIFVFRDVTRETAVDRMKTEFISVVSHELRTPLTAIKGYVDLIVGGQTGELNDLQREFLTIVQNSTSRLTALINDMLDISRIESGRVEVRQEAVDYARVVRETVATLAKEAEAKSITLAAEVPDETPAVSGDPDRIAQILVNLLSNGIKYTPSGGRVTVSVAPSETFVTTTITDTGIGISPEDQQRLFQKFFRADNSSTREAGGTGLGLAITKAILEKLNGSIMVESEPGKGSAFSFTLPIAARPPAGDVSAAPSGRQGLVLCVDDEPAILRLLSHQLGRHGFATVGAASGEEALRRARELSPDAITLDILMPGMNGFTTLRKLKDEEATRDIPVVLLSAVTADSPSGIRGAFAFLKKPFDEERLTQTVEAAVAGKGERATVLVVGDDRVAACLRERVGGGSARVIAATDQEEAEALAAQAPPDFVFLDPGTADVDATRLVTALRARPATREVPFVLLLEEEICGDGVIHVAPLGAGPITFEQLADEVGKLIEKGEIEVSPPPAATAV